MRFAMPHFIEKYHVHRVYVSFGGLLIRDRIFCVAYSIERELIKFWT